MRCCAHAAAQPSAAMNSRRPDVDCHVTIPWEAMVVQGDSTTLPSCSGDSACTPTVYAKSRFSNLKGIE